MTKATWMYDGKKAGPATVTATLDGSRAAKLQRMAEIREALVAEGRAFADERALNNAVRKRWCLEDRERREREAHFRRVGAAARKALRAAERKPLYVYAAPLRGLRPKPSAGAARRSVSSSFEA